jgi:Family of unknown function (DUF6328)
MKEHTFGAADATPTKGETTAQRIDRNWTEILQELRVIQTGTQILTGFLLTIAFQPTFTHLDQLQVQIYLGLVVLAALTTALGLAPVSLHRTLFRMGAKPMIVAVANRILKLTLAAVAILLAGTTLLLFDVLVGRSAGFLAGGVMLIVICGAWLLLPVVVRARLRRNSRKLA